MAYFPRHTVNIISSKPNEFIYVKTKAPYSGFIIETNSGQYFAGKDSSNPGKELLKAEKYSGEGKFGLNRDVVRYNILRENLKQERIKKKTIFSTKITPSEEDYERGHYKRYFLSKNNNPERVFEISEQAYDDFFKKRSKYDHYLYSAGIITWSLEGDVYTNNFNTLESVMGEVPGIKNAFPLLNEFYIMPEYSEGDSNKYNIPNRFYPNEEPIPANLPPTYKLPNVQNQKCLNCAFFNQNNNNCKKWKALVRQAYWCKSWKMIPIDMEVEFENYMNKIMAQKQKEKDRALANDLTQPPTNPKAKEIAEMEALEREKQRQIKIRNVRAYILSGEDPKWLESTRKKAEKNGRSLGAQALLEAQFVTPVESTSGGGVSSGGGNMPSGGGGSSGGGGGGY